ncbi:unnamed protein product [Hymenolepis diminuta]|uniref:Uncharacterized protein n=1 Tax=Hymenolepis diminuta TaxID=6216 RepID=A0A564XW76_HYMDI|nr:unnamed protein product [Hymenolepis diminuta]
MDSENKIQKHKQQKQKRITHIPFAKCSRTVQSSPFLSCPVHFTTVIRLPHSSTPGSHPRCTSSTSYLRCTHLPISIRRLPHHATSTHFNSSLTIPRNFNKNNSPLQLHSLLNLTNAPYLLLRPHFLLLPHSTPLHSTPLLHHHSPTSLNNMHYTSFPFSPTLTSPSPMHTEQVSACRSSTYLSSVLQLPIRHKKIPQIPFMMLQNSTLSTSSLSLSPPPRIHASVPRQECYNRITHIIIAISAVEPGGNCILFSSSSICTSAQIHFLRSHTLKFATLAS